MVPAMKPAQYVNPRTGAAWPTDEALWRAPDDGGYLNLSAGPGLTPEDIEQGEASLWRYAAALRLPARPERILGEGWTPLADAAWDGVPVKMKSDFLMPSGSFKDRGTAVMLNYLNQVGVTRVLEDSSGNGGSSIATFGAALGMECRILTPASAPKPKLYQMRAMGAEVVPVDGTRDAVAEAALREAETIFYASHNHQAYFLEGTKTLAFELWEQLGFRAPDNIVAPLGFGSNVMGCHIGFQELLARGQISGLPRIFGVQAANIAPFHAAYAAGSDTPVEIAPEPTMADGIASAKPLRFNEVMAALRQTNGACVAVGEDEIASALRQSLHLGFFIEPTCAAAGAGLSRLIADGTVRAGETTVLVLTGMGLKAVDKIGEVLGLEAG